MDNEAKEMIDALIKAQLVAANYGFDGIWFNLDDIIEELAKYYNIPL